MGKSAFIPRATTDDALKVSPTPGKKVLEVFKNFVGQKNVPASVIQILEDHEIKRFENPTEIHEGEDDLWIGLQGEATFVVGGTAINPVPHPTKAGEVKATAIEGGTEYIVREGDILYIPAGEPHTHFGSGRLFIVKIPLVKI